MRACLKKETMTKMTHCMHVWNSPQINCILKINCVCICMCVCVHVRLCVRACVWVWHVHRVVAHTFNQNNQEAEGSGSLCEFKANLLHLASSRMARTTERYLKTKTKKKRERKQSKPGHACMHCSLFWLWISQNQFTQAAAVNSQVWRRWCGTVN